jgi:large subunit ribosomal protein L5
MNLSEKYQKEIKPAIMEEFGIDNIMAAPELKKVVVSIGMKEAAHDKGALEKATAQLTEIAGQKPKLTRAKKSIANFKLREGDAVGLTVTLRGKKMWDFVTKMFTIVLPRVRDFHGVPLSGFDHQGNYTMGLTEQIVFPEIDYAKVDKIRGLQVTFVNTSRDVKIARRMLTLLGMPFEKK